VSQAPVRRLPTRYTVELLGSAPMPRRSRFSQKQTFTPSTGLRNIFAQVEAEEFLRSCLQGTGTTVPPPR
jgi:hypothetical protein